MRMKKRIAMPLMAILAAFMMFPESANADSFGSWGGSWGSGSHGSRLFGSHGGPVRNLLARAPLRTMLGRVRDRAGGWGSGGSWGSGSYGSYGSNGSNGSYGSNGSNGSYGSNGSNGSYGSTGGGSWGSSSNYGSTGSTGGSWGSSYGSSAPVYSSGYSTNSSYPVTMDSGCGFPVGQTMGSPVGVQGAYPAGGQIVDPYYYNGAQGGVIQGGFPEGESVIQGGGRAVNPAGNGGDLTPPKDGAGATDPTPQPNENDTTMNRRLLESTIDIQLPKGAKVYVNGRLTEKTGAYRTFVARAQKPDRNYRYEITAVNDGEEQVQTFTMAAGSSKSLSFEFSAMTVVALEVPENAKVELAGNLIKGSGVERKFTTKKLKKGETWDDYKVVVTYQRNGKEVVQEKTLDVIGGQAYTLSFVDTVDADAVAVKNP